MALVNTEERERYPIPHEEGAWLEIRPLTGPEVRRASDSQSAGTIKRYSDSLGALTSIRDDRTADEKEEERKDPEKAKRQFDPDVLLPLAIVGWGADTPDLAKRYGYDATVSPDGIKLLDPLTEEWAWRIVWEMNIRPPQTESDSSPSSSSPSELMAAGLSRESLETPGPSSEPASGSATPSTRETSRTGS